jgi:hypothetical protein
LRANLGSAATFRDVSRGAVNRRGRVPGAGMNMAQTPNGRVCQKRMLAASPVSQALAVSERVAGLPAAISQTVRRSFDRLHAVSQQALLC